MSIILASSLLFSVGVQTFSTSYLLQENQATVYAAPAATATLKSQGVPDSFIKSFLISPIAGGVSLGSTGLTIANVTFGDLTKLVALDLSTVANPDLLTTITGTAHFWTKTQYGEGNSTAGAAIAMAVTSATNITSLDLNGLLGVPGATGQMALVNFVQNWLKDTTATGSTLIAQLLSTAPNLKAIDLSNNAIEATGADWAFGIGTYNVELIKLVSGGGAIYVAGNPATDPTKSSTLSLPAEAGSAVQQDKVMMPPAISLTGNGSSISAETAKEIAATGGIDSPIATVVNPALAPAAETGSSSTSSSELAATSSVSSVANSSDATSAAAPTNGTDSSTVTPPSKVTSGGTGLYDTASLGVGKLQISNTNNITQLLPKGVTANTSLKDWGLPAPFLNAIINNSMTFDGHTLSDHGITAATVTFGNLMNISKLDLSDRDGTNGINAWMAKQPDYQMSIYGSDSWKDATKFNATSQGFASLWAVLMATTTVSSIDISGWGSQLTMENANWSASFGFLDLTQLPLLKQLSIAFDGLGNQLFSGNDFKLFHNSSLTTIDISGNIMTSLGGTSGSSVMVSGYPKLVNLNMSDMKQMSTFPPELDNGDNVFAKRVQSLQIDNDNFSKLPDWITVAAQNGLIILTAAGNNLTSANTLLLQKPSSLEFMDLTGQAVTGGFMDSFYLDNSGTGAIQQYNQIMNDPEMQIWMANDPTGPLAQSVKDMRAQIDQRSEYQSILNGYTDLLQRAELHSDEQSITVSVTVTTSVVINGQSYTVKVPYDATKTYTDAQLKAMALQQLQATHAELASLSIDDLTVTKINRPLTVKEIIDYVEAHQDEPSLASFDLSSLKALDPNALATYAELPPAPKPEDYGSNVPTYFQMEGTVVNSMKEVVVTQATITVAKIEQAKAELIAAGDTEGAAKLQEEINLVKAALQNIPKIAGASTDSDFFFVRSLTRAINEAVITTTTAAVEGVTTQLSTEQTKNLIAQAIADGRISAETGAQLIASGNAGSLLDKAKAVVQNAVDNGSIVQKVADIITKDAQSVQDIKDGITTAMATKDSDGRGLVNATVGNDLLNSVTTIVKQGSTGFTTDLTAAVGAAVVESVAQAIADATGEDIDTIRNQIKDNVITDASQVAQSLKDQGAVILTGDGKVDDTKNITAVVAQGQIAAGNATASALNDTLPADAKIGADGKAGAASSDTNVNPTAVPKIAQGAQFGAITSALNDFVHPINAELFDRLLPMVTTNQAKGLSVGIIDDRALGDRTPYVITARMARPFTNAATNDVLTDAELILTKGSAVVPTMSELTTPTERAQNKDGLNQQNLVTLQNSNQVTQVADGFSTTNTGSANLVYGQMYLYIPQDPDHAIQQGTYGTTIDWTLQSGPANDAD